MTGAQFKKALAAAGLSQRAAAKKFGVNERTVRRWASGEDPVPQTVQMLLPFIATGHAQIISVKR